MDAIILERYFEPDRPVSREEQLRLILKQIGQPLRDFAEAALASPSGLRFRRLPASRRHHHAQPGGLFQHSLEVALMAGQAAWQWLSPPEVELTLLGGLFHDFGKIATMQPDGFSSLQGHFVRHETATLELLAPYLRQLEHKFPLGANMLREVFAGSNHKDHYPAFPGALLVRMADQFSTARERRTTLFTGMPDYHYYTHDPIHHQTYMRIPQTRLC